LYKLLDYKQFTLVFGVQLHFWSQVKLMKILLIATVILCSAAAFGQAGVSAVSNQAVPLQIADHPQHATYASMASENPLVGGGAETYSYARGERPLWEFGPVSEPLPLGDIARAIRKEKMTAKRAAKIVEKQGS
jgi:hypothetical protein